MKTRVKSHLKNKKGLTLMETLIAVAIVVILLGVAFIGIQGLVDRINQTKLDNVAQSMYVSAQNRIRELKASGEIDRLLTITSVADKPADWEDDPAADTVDYSDLRYIYHIKDDPLASTPSDLVNFVFPKGSIDENVLNDHWVIELDPVTGYVYSAFYSEKRSSADFYINNDDTLDLNVEGDSSIRFKDFRHSLKGKNKLGYYGGKANMPAYVGGDKINASLNVMNADILKAKMTAILPIDSAIGTNDLAFTLTVKGKTSKNTVTLRPIVTLTLGATKVFSASVILDSLDDSNPLVSQHFKDTFGAITWEPAGVEPRTGSLIPGEDLELSFTVTSNDDSVLDVGPITRTVNSLFASLNPDDPTEAYIAYGRHLQNLDSDISGLPAGDVTAAKQISDIDFNDESDSALSPEEQFLWMSIYGEKKFTPINNPDLNKYSGYNHETASDSFKILNMHIGTNEQAGLFGVFAGDEIAGVTLVNEKIDGGTYVGGLVGATASDLTIKDCRLYVENFADGTYADNIFLKGTSKIGGLVGRSTANNFLTIKDSFASTIIEGEGAIGGLIGSKTNGSALIQDSYADSYLIGGASTSKIGGLAGELPQGSSITGSYSAGFGMIKSGVTGIASSAGFAPSSISNVINSYSLFNSSESKATTIFSTLLSSTTVNNVYYFESGDTNLVNSEEYNFISNAAAKAAFTGSNYSDDDNEFDTYPYNQKAGLELVKYPYVSIIGLPHYGDWEKPPMPAELKFGKAGLFYWEKVDGGSDPRYQIYMVGRKGKSGSYEAVFHDTTSVEHDEGGTVKEYGYGYYVAKKGTGNETYTLGKSWANVNVPANRNTSAEKSFNENIDYSGYVFTCFNTCNEANPATPYDAVDANYMFMEGDEQNAAVTLTPEGEDDLRYSFCPFFAKSIKLEGWNSGTNPALQYEPGTKDNPYRIRSLDQLQFINWNSADKKCNKWVLRNNYDKFPYLHATKKGGLINYSDGLGWTYKGNVAGTGEEGWDNFETLRANQNFIQDYDIECKDSNGNYCPIAALGHTTGPQIDSFRLPLYAWFGGSFDGQSYKIKNLSITSKCFSVGVFGTTVGARIQNVVLIRDLEDTGPGSEDIGVITRQADSPSGFYAIGTLVGIANDYSKGIHDPLLYPNLSTGVYEGFIENCAVAGYEVIDASTNPVTSGETAIGGLVGVLRTKIDRCSAVNTIRINTYPYRGSVSTHFSGYGDHISVGGIAGRNQTIIKNCYSGGRVIVHPNLTVATSEAKIYISGIAASAVTPRFLNTSHSDARMFRKPEYKNCYSYMELPEPVANRIFVGTIAANANHMSAGAALPTFYVGGIINKSYYYREYYKIGQESLPEEYYYWTNTWEGQSIERPHYSMSQAHFVGELNNDPDEPYAQVSPDHYSFPCGVAALEGKDYPFAAVITQDYKNDPSDPDGIKHVHYGEWPEAIPYTGNLILNHYNETKEYTNHRYVYKNGDNGISPNLISTETNKIFSTLNEEMDIKGSSLSTGATFDGWYVNHEVTRKKLLNTDGTIYTGAGDIAGITQDGIFNVNLDVYPEGDIELYAMWKIRYNRLTLASSTKTLPDTTSAKKYLVVARVPRVPSEGEDIQEYDDYCMTGDSPPGPGPGDNNPVSVREVELHYDESEGDYYLASPVNNSTMLWNVGGLTGWKYFRLNKVDSFIYIKRLDKTSNNITDVVFGSATGADLNFAYNSGAHNLYISNGNWRILFEEGKFIFESSDQNTIKTQDGGIWLFECNPTTEERLHEFK